MSGGTALTRTRPLVVAGSRMLPATRAELATFAAVIANTDEQPWSAKRLQRECAAADALIAFMPDRIDVDFLTACPRLRVIAGALKGSDNIDLTACAARGIEVTVVSDLLSQPTAELGLALLLNLLRHLPAGDHAVRQGHQGWLPTLYGQTLVGGDIGILGMGGVGLALATLLRGFAARLFYHDPRRLAVEQERSLGLEWVSAEALPVVSRTALVLAAPLVPATLQWLDTARLRHLAPGAVVVNIGRGSVVDEAAVLAALQRGSLAGYAADVFAFEDHSQAGRPDRVLPGLLSHPRTVFTPHLGSAVQSVRLAIERAAIAEVRRVFASGHPAPAPTADAVSSA